jgi:hypothetical protein
MGINLAPGAYAILAASFTDSSGGDYTLAVTETEFIEFGDTVEGTLPEDGTPFIRAFQVDEPASATFTANLVSSSYSDLAIEVRGPNDTYLGAAANTLDVPLREAGTYAIAVSSPADAGEAFTLEMEAGPPIEDGGGPIELGQTVDGELLSSYQVDTWTFTINQPTAVNIDVTTRGWRDGLNVQVLDADGLYLYSGSESSYLQNLPLYTPGEYQLVVSTWNERGPYTLTLGRGEMPVDGGGSISYGQTITGRLNSPGQRDSWVFDAHANDVFTAYLTSDEFDTWLTVLDSNGLILIENDDGGENTNSLIMDYMVPAAGTYTLQVRSFNNTSTGSYSLSFNFGSFVPGLPSPTPSPIFTPTPSGQFPPTPTAIMPPTAGPLPVANTVISYGMTFQAALIYPSQHDTWLFYALAGDTVVINMQSQYFDSFLELRDANGVLLVNNDDGGGGLHAAIRYRVPEAGYYIITTQSLGGLGTGTYVLSLDVER